MEDTTLSIFLSHDYWVLTNVKTESSLCFQEWCRLRMQDFVHQVCTSFKQIMIYVLWLQVHVSSKWSFMIWISLAYWEELRWLNCNEEIFCLWTFKFFFYFLLHFVGSLLHWSVVNFWLLHLSLTFTPKCCKWSILFNFMGSWTF